MLDHHLPIQDLPISARSVDTFFDWFDMDSSQPLDDKAASFDDDEHWQRIYSDLMNVERSMDHPHLQLCNTAIEHSPLWSSDFEKQIDVVQNSDTDASSSSPSHNTGSLVDDNAEQHVDLQEWMVVDESSKKLRRPKLYEFLRLLLNNPRYTSYIAWTDEKRVVFKIKKPAEVANLWKEVKVRKTTGCMDYDTFARGIRYYYKSKLMIKTNTRHTYCFAQNSCVPETNS